jgi:hypothetical protein
MQVISNIYVSLVNRENTLVVHYVRFYMKSHCNYNFVCYCVYV